MSVSLRMSERRLRRLPATAPADATRAGMGRACCRSDRAARRAIAPGSGPAACRARPRRGRPGSRRRRAASPSPTPSDRPSACRRARPPRTGGAGQAVGFRQVVDDRRELGAACRAAPRPIMFSTVASHWLRVRRIAVDVLERMALVPQIRRRRPPRSGATLRAGAGRGVGRRGGGCGACIAAAGARRARSVAVRVKTSSASCSVNCDIGRDYTGRAPFKEAPMRDCDPTRSADRRGCRRRAAAAADSPRRLRPPPGARRQDGRLKQSVSRWCYGEDPDAGVLQGGQTDGTDGDRPARGARLGRSSATTA